MLSFSYSAAQREKFQSDKVACFPSNITIDIEEKERVLNFDNLKRLQNFETVLRHLYAAEPLDNPGKPVQITHENNKTNLTITLKGDVEYARQFLKECSLIDINAYHQLGGPK